VKSNKTVINQATVPWLLTDGGVNKLFITLRDLNEPSAWGSEGLINYDAHPRETRPVDHTSLPVRAAAGLTAIRLTLNAAGR